MSQVYQEMIDLTPFGREYINMWHEANDDVNKWVEKKIPGLKTSANKILAIVIIAAIFVLVMIGSPLCTIWIMA
jgi:hypothetical protein